MPEQQPQEARSAASSCDQPMRGIYGAVTICARPAGHAGKHDPIWNHEDWPEASSAAQDRGRGLLSAATMARRFHELYEELAPACGYETREETRVPWPELPADNRRLMISVCMLILAEMREEGALRDGEPV